jgi:polysaccharide deacetylase 2 family uncharacterized protein YibQ
MIGRGLRLRRRLWLVLAGLFLLVAAPVFRLTGGDGRIEYIGVPRLQLPMPSAPPGMSPVGADAERASAASAGLAAMPPVFPALIEENPFGPLPRIGPDGRRPLLAYARPFDLDDQRPRLALLVVGLGLQADLSQAAIALPGEVSLQFSAYAPDLPGWVGRARRAGHEVLLDLPMQPPDYPASDPGPHGLLATASDEDNLQRLDWLLARATGYVAVAGSGAGFAGSGRAAAVLDVLARRGLALVELGERHLEAGAGAVGLPYASAPTTIDAELSLPSIERALARLETEALRQGSALVLVQGYPSSLERLRRWTASLRDKGLVLAPVSALLIRQPWLAAAARGGAEPRGRSQS